MEDGKGPKEESTFFQLSFVWAKQIDGKMSIDKKKINFMKEDSGKKG